MAVDLTSGVGDETIGIRPRRLPSLISTLKGLVGNGLYLNTVTSGLDEA